MFKFKFIFILLFPFIVNAQSDLDSILKGGEIIVNGLTFLKGTDKDIVKEAKQMGFI